jgi:hypothetical protein
MSSLRHLSVAGCFALLFLSASHGAMAQATGPALTIDEIRVCLCQEKLVEQRRAEVDAQAVLLDERQQELNGLDTEIKRQAAALPSSDQVGQQVLQDLIRQQMALRNMIQLQIRPGYNVLVSDLRQQVEAYNAQCTGRPRYTSDVQQASANLVCPVP